MANGVPNAFKQGLLLGSFATLASAPVPYFLLVGSGYTFDPDTDDFRDQVDNEIAGSNYNQGGYALSSPVISTNATNNEAVFDAADVFIANITFDTDAQAAVIYGSTGTDSEDPIIAYIDFTTGQAVTAGTFQITWAAGGILRSYIGKG
jgi:hypothetical protein